MLSKLFRPRERAAPPSIPPGERVYAIGDIHGRLDLLDALLAQIERDKAEAGPARTTLIFLGDLVDRGPHSAQVIDRLIALAAAGGVRFLAGNHEEVFLRTLDRDPKATRLFCRIGGRETLLSYGLDPVEYGQLTFDALTERAIDLVPLAHQRFLASFEDIIVVGDYVFVHAGIRPGVDLAAQTTSDLRWIREPFLTTRDRLEKMVVHGHTISEQPVFSPARIGIDTGAYATGVLSALVLEGTAQRVLATAAVSAAPQD